MRLSRQVLAGFLCACGVLAVAASAQAWTCPAKCELDLVDPEGGFFCATYYVLITGCEVLEPNFCVEDWCWEGRLETPAETGGQAQRCEAAPESTESLSEPTLRVVQVETPIARI